ncbi:hypothetical protein CPB85DRAFT_1443359 [Mucidula mucida]|nr:hypothetical protein CPB85DRAFT_1443359 [Mucidula mucida]
METRCFFLPPSSPISLWEPTVFGLSLPSLGDQRAALHRLALTEEVSLPLCVAIPAMSLFVLASPVVSDMALLVRLLQLWGTLKLCLLQSGTAWIKAVRFDVSVILFDCGNMIRSSELSTSLKRSADQSRLLNVVVQQNRVQSVLQQVGAQGETES